MPFFGAVSHNLGGLTILAPELWSLIEQWVYFVLILGGLAVPLCIVAKRYE